MGIDLLASLLALLSLVTEFHLYDFFFKINDEGREVEEGKGKGDICSRDLGLS